ncbi:helix-turn-helix domain-containing protein [Nocardia fluminea]|uniref:DNA-binding transcriptional MerR regulator n=1 Tax=Nocardia fluminea TaxID=134984 RepID=A0A2N3WVY3_9NOCA|nr:MerR family transcriptional regulator [Nocardia fluminea]PKV98023.1 DNA-binding transcriptional MerR regulator [Nocardia fluminea]
MMAWSTRQLAELAGTTVKTVRHYHEIGLLSEPERASNGYKQYRTEHLVRLLQIKRLSDLGVPLAQIAAMGRGDEDPDDAIRVLDAELGATIDRLQRIRAELAVILRHRAPADVPAGFGRIARDLSESDRSLIMVYSRLFTPEAMAQLSDMMELRHPTDDEFEKLPGDADADTIADLAGRMAPVIRELHQRYPWVADPGAYSERGGEVTGDTIVQVLRDLYNSAQLQVLQRVDSIIAESAADRR